MMTNKQLQPLELSNTSKDADAAIWNQRLQEQQVIDKSPQTWYNSCWLLSECYMYRRISQIFSLTYVNKLNLSHQSYINNNY